MKHFLKIRGTVIALVITVISITTCDKQNLPVVTTTAISGITPTTALSGGNVTNDGGADVTSRGICWNTSENPSINNTKTSNGTGDGIFTCSITQLTPNTKYYVKAYAVNNAGVGYGNQVSFTTQQKTLATLTTTEVTAITTTSAISGGNITSDGNDAITARGICWSTSVNPTISNSLTINVIGMGTFTSNITGLTANTTYYVRAYATNSTGTSYGDQVTFKTLSVNIVMPSVSTSAITDIGQTSAKGGGNISSEGSSSIIGRGVCWSTSSNPTLQNNFTLDGTGPGSYTSTISILIANTTYYVRAYATNSEGTGYGAIVTFKTLSSTIVIPTLTTTAITEASGTTAKSGGSITSDGGAPITTKGVCWSTVANPTTANSKTSDGSGTGTFTSSITGLTANTTYYIRAYAINIVGTGYGNQVTLVPNAAAILTTTALSEVTISSAVGGGNITSDGGCTVTGRGLCWNITGNPTISDSKTSCGSGTGIFTCSLTGLAANTTYYVRAYATNCSGTAYGNLITFNTPPANLYDPPIIGAPTTSTGSFSVTLGYSWGLLGSNLDYYELEESKTSSTSGFASIYKSAAGTHTSTLSIPLTRTTGTYYYRGRVYKGSPTPGFSSYSSTVMVVVTANARSITLINNGPTTTKLTDVVQIKIGSSENGVCVRSDLLTNDPAECLSTIGKSIAPGESMKIDITLGADYYIFIGMGRWEAVVPPLCSVPSWSKATYFNEASTGNPYWVWVIVKITGQSSGNWDWTISGSYLSGTLTVTPKGNTPILFNRTNYSKIN